jgi:SPP1 family predicted phage head-tail adaptor
MIKAGDLNTKITFQSATYSYNGTNQKIPLWADAATVDASMETTGGKKFYAAQKANSETTAVFTIRFNRWVNERQRIKLGNRIFQILPPINDVNNRHEELIISAKEVV